MVRTISDFRELNKCIVRKPYPILKIGTTLQELEGFTYSTALALKPSDLTQRHPRCVLSSSLGKSTLIRDSPWALEAHQIQPNPK
jgi:hypothetical protein